MSSNIIRVLSLAGLCLLCCSGFASCASSTVLEDDVKPTSTGVAELDATQQTGNDEISDEGAPVNNTPKSDEDEELSDSELKDITDTTGEPDRDTETEGTLIDDESNELPDAADEHAVGGDTEKDDRAGRDEHEDEKPATNDQPAVPTDPRLAGSFTKQWSEWSECSQSCGIATQTRDMMCIPPRPGCDLDLDDRDVRQCSGDDDKCAQQTFQDANTVFKIDEAELRYWDIKLICWVVLTLATSIAFGLGLCICYRMSMVGEEKKEMIRYKFSDVSLDQQPARDVHQQSEDQQDSEFRPWVNDYAPVSVDDGSGTQVLLGIAAMP